MIFDSGKASISHSVRFLKNYYDSLQAHTDYAVSSDSKGKKLMYTVEANNDEGY